MPRGEPKRSPITLSPVLSAPAPADDPTPVIALRESSIITMARVGALDISQVEAAFQFRNLWMEFERLYPRENLFERIDDSLDVNRGHRDIRRLQAYQRLCACRRLLGRYGFELVVKICAEGFSLTEMFGTRRERDTAADLLRVHLDELGSLDLCLHLDDAQSNRA